MEPNRNNFQNCASKPSSAPKLCQETKPNRMMPATNVHSETAPNPSYSRTANTNHHRSRAIAHYRSKVANLPPCELHSVASTNRSPRDRSNCRKDSKHYKMTRPVAVPDLAKLASPVPIDLHPPADWRKYPEDLLELLLGPGGEPAGYR
jgi:hypothetical protein